MYLGQLVEGLRDTDDGEDMEMTPEAEETESAKLVNTAKLNSAVQQDMTMTVDCAAIREDGKFVEMGDKAGIASMAKGRGGALADFNLDGLVDLLVVNQGSPVEIWRNTTEGAGRFLQITLRQKGANRDAVGAWIEVKTGDVIQRREVTIGHLWLDIGSRAAALASSTNAAFCCVMLSSWLTDWLICATLSLCSEDAAVISSMMPDTRRTLLTISVMVWPAWLTRREPSAQCSASRGMMTRVLPSPMLSCHRLGSADCANARTGRTAMAAPTAAKNKAVAAKGSAVRRKVLDSQC